jgi:hypothetical protein
VFDVKNWAVPVVPVVLEYVKVGDPLVAVPADIDVVL